MASSGLNPQQGGDQRVEVFVGVIQRQRGADSTLQTEAA